MSIITPDDDRTFDAYEKPMFGFHGQFQTKKSWPLSFFQTSIPIEQIDILKTAGEALEPGHFKELIQRDIDEDRVKKIVEDTKACFNDEVVGRTQQSIIGYDNLFRGFVVKKWFATQESDCFCEDCNKTLVKLAVNCCNKAWKHRNKEYHDSDKQRVS